MKISQREARRLQKLVAALQDQLRNQKNCWRSDWAPGWINIENLTLTAESFAKVRTARKLGHAVILVPSERDTQVLLYADRL